MSAWSLGFVTRVVLGTGPTWPARIWGGLQPPEPGPPDPDWPTAGPLRVSPEETRTCHAVEFPKEPGLESWASPWRTPPPSICGSLPSPPSAHGPSQLLQVEVSWGAQALWSLGYGTVPCLWAPHTDRTQPAQPPFPGWWAPARCLSSISRGLSPAGRGPSRGRQLHAGLYGHEALLGRLPGHLRARLSG